MIGSLNLLPQHARETTETLNLPYLIEWAPRRLFNFSYFRCALIRGRRLFGGGTYLEVSYHKDKTFWLCNFIYLVSIFSWLYWTKEHQDILTFNWKTSLLMKINSHCWLRTALQRLQCIFIIIWEYSNKHRTGAAALINFSAPCAALNRGRRLFGGAAYSSKYGIWNFGRQREYYGLLKSGQLVITSLWKKLRLF